MSRLDYLLYLIVHSHCIVSSQQWYGIVVQSQYTRNNRMRIFASHEILHLHLASPLTASSPSHEFPSDNKVSPCLCNRGCATSDSCQELETIKEILVSRLDIFKMSIPPPPRLENFDNVDIRLGQESVWRRSY